MLTHFNYYLFHFLNKKGRDPTEGSNKYQGLIISIRRALLDVFWIREPGSVSGKFTIMSNMGTMARAELCL